MPAFDDHPVVLLMRRYGLTQSELAKRANVSRSTVDQIVQGRVKRVHIRVLHVLAKMSSIPPSNIEEAVQRWRENPPTFYPKQRHQMVLSLHPADLPRVFPTFADWRKEFAPNPSLFASMLRENRLTITKYEEGKFKGGMPASLHKAIVRTFRVSDEYAVALGRLPL